MLLNGNGHAANSKQGEGRAHSCGMFLVNHLGLSFHGGFALGLIMSRAADCRFVEGMHYLAGFAVGKGFGNRAHPGLHTTPKPAAPSSHSVWLAGPIVGPIVVSPPVLDPSLDDRSWLPSSILGVLL